MNRPDLSEIEAIARAELDPKFTAREKAINNGRNVIRSSANAIRSIHRGELDAARALMAEAHELLAESTAALEDHPDVNVGILADAAKEYAEARLTMALAHNEPLPLPAELGMRVAPYLKGLGEAVGELRRRLLDKLRSAELDEAERLLGVMDEVVDLLASLDYPDGMTGGLRRTTDVSRSLVERSRADLTTTIVQERLRADLDTR
ncbi:MAG TPA: haloacid dehalogenase [Actinobacteria bacterium]|nr:haloacid dehalogenase [Actinomycetota bacterium]